MSTKAESLRKVTHTKADTQRWQIYKVLLQHGAMNRRRIAQLTKLEIGTVCGRIAEMQADRQLVDAGVIRCPVTGALTETVKLRPSRRRV